MTDHGREAADVPDFAIRPAVRADADALARFVNMAGEGMPLHLWTRLSGGGEDPWEIGRKRALREAGGFSYRNAMIAEAGGRPLGCMIGYRLPDETQAVDHSALPPMFVPLEELEALAAGTWYVNVLAVEPDMRGLGIGTRFLAMAGTKARDEGARGESIIVADANVGAIRLYQSCGFRKAASRPIVKEDWRSDSTRWILLTRMV